MDKKNSAAVRIHIIMNGIVQVVMTAGISFAAIHFERIAILWFYLIPAVLMNASYRTKDGENID